jgi:hypothetical protein
VGRDGARATARARLAELVVTMSPGDRLPSVGDLQREFGVGTGTVSAAMGELQSSGAVEVDARQHRGSFLVGRDLGRLWEVMRWRPMLGVLPLPGSLEFEGLASGLRSELTRLGVPVALIYAHGSTQRYEMVVTERADFAVMSASASAFLSASSSPTRPATEVVIGLGPDSYYATDSVVVIAGSERDQLPAHPRVGIDSASYDHTQLTHSEFHEGEFVDVRYGLLPAAVSAGMVDVAVWHRTSLGIGILDSRLTTWPLTQPAAQSLHGDLSHAVVVSLATNSLARAALADVDPALVEQTQRRVASGAALPLF